MADDSAQALDRIDRALARIEAAAVSHIHSADALAKRHEVLRRRIGEAIGALDTMISQGPGD